MIGAAPVGKGYLASHPGHGIHAFEGAGQVDLDTRVEGLVEEVVVLALMRFVAAVRLGGEAEVLGLLSALLDPSGEPTRAPTRPAVTVSRPDPEIIAAVVAAAPCTGWARPARRLRRSADLLIELGPYFRDGSPVLTLRYAPGEGAWSIEQRA